MGGYGGRTSITYQNGVATFLVDNTMSVSSIEAEYYWGKGKGNSRDNPNGPDGPRHNVRQFFNLV